MNDLREALEQLAERGSPRPPGEVADEVVDGLGHAPLPSLPRRRPLLLAAAATAVLAAAGVLVAGNDDDSPVLLTTETTVAPPLPGTTALPSPSTSAPPSDRPATRWHTVDESSMPMPKGGRYHAVAADRTTFVAVGEADEDPERSAEVDGWVAWSTDGRTWHRATGPFSGPGFQRVNDVVAVDGGFVAVGEWGNAVHNSDPAVWRSGNGRAWQRVELPPEYHPGPQHRMSLRAVAEHKGVVVATGIDTSNPGTGPFGGAWRSTDGGRTWTRILGAEQADMGTSGEQPVAVAAGPKGFVIVGFATVDGSGPPEARAWFSADGSAWEEVPVRAGGMTSRMSAVAMGRLGWVAVGTRDGRGAAWTSVDGRSWVPAGAAFEATPTEKETSLSALIATAEGLTAVGDSDGPTEWTSSDGRRWGRMPDGPRAASRAWARDLVSANGRVVVVGARDLGTMSAKVEQGPVQLPVIWVRDGA